MRLLALILVAGCGRASGVDGESVKVGEYGMHLSDVTMDARGGAWFTLAHSDSGDPAVACRLDDALTCAVIPGSGGAAVTIAAPVGDATPAIGVRALDAVTYRRPFTWEELYRLNVPVAAPASVWPDGGMVVATADGVVLWPRGAAAPTLTVRPRDAALFGDLLVWTEVDDQAKWHLHAASVTPAAIGASRDLAQLDGDAREVCVEGDTLGLWLASGRLAMVDLATGRTVIDEVVRDRGVGELACRSTGAAIVQAEIGDGFVHGRYCDAAGCREVRATFDAPRSNYNRATLIESGVLWLATSMERERELVVWLGEPGSQGALSRWRMGRSHNYQEAQVAPYHDGVIASYWGELVVLDRAGKPRKVTLRWEGEPPPWWTP